jgi:hypothetical protein
MTRIRSPTDRCPGFLNSAPTFDVRQRLDELHSGNGNTDRVETQRIAIEPEIILVSGAMARSSPLRPDLI